MGFLRVMGLLLLGLLALYAVLWVALRLRERGRLAEEWEVRGGPGEREDYVRAGMAAYSRSLQSRLLWLVVVAPMAAFVVLLYVLNVS